MIIVSSYWLWVRYVCRYGFLSNNDKGILLELHFIEIREWKHVGDFSDYFSKLSAIMVLKKCPQDIKYHVYPRDTYSTVPFKIYTEILFVKAYFYII